MRAAIMQDMTLDYVGTRQDFTLIAKKTTQHRLYFTDIQGKEPLSISTATFLGTVRGADGAEYAIVCSHADTTGILNVEFPALEAGRYEFEIDSQCEAGKQRLVFGYLGVYASVNHLMADIGETESRTLMVRVPDKPKAQIMLEWRASSAILGMAEDILNAANEVKKYATILTNCEQKVQAIEAKITMLEGNILSAVVPNTSTNTWWICGVDTLVQVTGDPGKSPQISQHGTWLLYDPINGEWIDTGQNARGEDGHSPYISALGTWVTWNALLGEYRDTGLSAVGKDGVDGATVRRILVDAVTDIPSEGETCCGGFYYYVPNANGTYDVYAWLERKNGTAGWVRVGEANDIATAEVYGLTKLATDIPVQGGAPVGNNAGGQLSVPLAEPTVAGVFLPSCWDYLENETSGAVGRTEDGRARAEAASYVRFGTVRLSRTETVGCGCIGLLAPDNNGIQRVGVCWATNVTGGGVMLSTNETISHGGLIGRNADGQIVVREAGYRIYGAVCFGTAADITVNDAPHVITIAKCNGINTYNTYAGNMINSMNINLAQQGCLKYNGGGPNGENTGNSLWLSHDESLNITSGSLTIKPYLEQYYVPLTKLNEYYTATETDTKLAECVKKTPLWDGVEVMTKAELDALTTRKARTLYIVCNKTVQA